jgi:hypothetical protein
MATSKSRTACLLKKKEMGEFSEQSTSWEIILEPMTGNVVISKVDVHVYRTKQGKSKVP